MDKAEYIKKVLSLCEEGTILVSEYINATSYISLQCKNGHTRQVTTNNIVSKGGGRVCKECIGKTTSGKKSQELVTKEFLFKEYILIGEYIGANIKVLAKDSRCGHEYMVTPSSVTRGRNVICPICFPSRRSTYSHEDFCKELTKYFLSPNDTFLNFKTNISVTNTLCGHTYHINPGHLLYEGIGSNCSVCAQVGSIKDRFFTKLIEGSLELKDEYDGAQKSIEIYNTKCGHTYNVIPNNLVNTNTGLICRTCTPTIQVSRGETEVADFISSIYDGWLIRSERQILNNSKELDIVLPDLGIAIEYNGSRWHSDILKDSTYHLKKTEEIDSYGYRLIHISDTEWIGKQDIVKSRLRSILGKSSKIYARKTVLKEIPFPREFLENNHIQGAGAPTRFNYGLFYEDNLIAVMTFGTPRFNNKYTYELVRYCSLLSTTITGGASKLLAHFREAHQGSIISYADRRWSTGGMYAKIGFEFSHYSAPNYRYNKYKTSLSRYQCQKHLLKDMFPSIYKDEKSERDIMVEAGFDKVFDCGNSVWVIK